MAVSKTPKDNTWQSWRDRYDTSKVLDLPGGLLERAWDPTDADRKAAWSLYVELETRIATQSLHFRSGDEETALGSLHSLFQTTRKLLNEHGADGNHFSVLALQMLNEMIRPVTAKWHKKLVDKRLSNDDERREFRAELRHLQGRLIPLARLMAILATRGDVPSVGIAKQKAAKKSRGVDPINGLIRFPPDSVAGPGDQCAVFQAEKQEILDRRAAAGLEKSKEVDDLVGLCCSGGGIRSASFCLGVVQRLAETGMMRDVDYLSTVSGGGYFGGFVSSYLNSNEKVVGLEAEQLPFHENNAPEPEPIRHLRNHTKYLLKGGVLGQARMIALIGAGVVVNFLSLLPFILLAVLVLKAGQSVHTGWTGWFGWASLVLAGLVAAILFVLPFVHRNDPQSQRRRKLEVVGIVSVIGAVSLWLIGVVVPQAFDGLTGWIIFLGLPSYWILILLLGVSILLLASGVASGMDKPRGKLLIALAGLAGPLLILCSVFWLASVFATAEPQSWILAILALATSVFWVWHTNINYFTPHRYYRNRLAETFLLRKGECGSTVLDGQKLSGMRTGDFAKSAPYHLINAALNLPASTKPELRGRNSDFFLFSQRFCGSPLLGYCKTVELEKVDPEVDLGTAMAISGAAASSHMGTKEVGGVSFWLALFNIRLGYWLPNVRWIGDNVPLDKRTWRSRVPQPWHLLFELAGKLDEDTAYVNLSDGGHIENLGMYELLRRRCKLIVSLDGEADRDMTFDGLIKVIRFARIDFGIDIDIDLSDLQKDAKGHSKAHFALGKIHYDANNTGLLLYIKNSLTGNERDYIQDYRLRSPDFPHETTADQFFTEPQYEAYRALGYHIGGDLFRREIDTQDATRVRELFQGLAENLLEEFTLS